MERKMSHKKGCFGQELYTKLYNEYLTANDILRFIFYSVYVLLPLR